MSNPESADTGGRAFAAVDAIVALSAKTAPCLGPANGAVRIVADALAAEAWRHGYAAGMIDARQNNLSDAEVTKLLAGPVGDEFGDLVPGPRTPASDGDGVSPEHGAIYDCTGRMFNTCSFAGLDLLTSEQIRPLLARARKLEDDLDALIEAAEEALEAGPRLAGGCDDDGPVPDPTPLLETSKLDSSPPDTELRLKERAESAAESVLDHHAERLDKQLLDAPMLRTLMAETYTFGFVAGVDDAQHELNVLATRVTADLREVNASFETDAK